MIRQKQYTKKQKEVNKTNKNRNNAEYMCISHVHGG